MFVGNVLHTLLTKLYIAFLKTATSVVTSRALGPTGRGEFFAVTQLAGFTNTLGTFSVGEGIIYFLASARIPRNEAFGLVFYSLMLFCAPIISFLLLFEIFGVFEILGFSNSDLISFVYIFIPLFMVEYLCSSALKGLREYKFANKVSVLCRSLLVFGIVFSLLIFGLDLSGTLHVFVGAYLCTSLIYMVALISKSQTISFPSLRKFKEVLNYSLKAHPAIVISEAEYRSDIFLLMYFLNLTALGIYSVGVSFGQLIWYVSNAVNNIIFPELANEAAINEKNTFFEKVLRINFLINSVIICSLGAIGFWLIPFVFGDEFSDAYFVFLMLSPGLLFDTISRNLVNNKYIAVCPFFSI